MTPQLAKGGSQLPRQGWKRCNHLPRPSPGRRGSPQGLCQRPPAGGSRDLSYGRTTSPRSLCFWGPTYKSRRLVWASLPPPVTRAP